MCHKPKTATLSPHKIISASCPARKHATTTHETRPNHQYLRVFDNKGAKNLYPSGA